MCGVNPSPQNEDNLQQCLKKKSIDLGKCIIDCKNDQSCEQSCVNLFKVRYDECPCQVRKTKKPPIQKKKLTSKIQNDCPFGCPCDAFDCQADKKSVLVLNTYSSSNKPLLIKFDGE